MPFHNDLFGENKMKFEAQEIDLKMELVTLKKEKVDLEPTTIVTAEEALRIIDIWTVTEKDEKLTLISVIAEQLATVYPKKASWFLSNFDPYTLSEMVKYVAGALGGLRKNGESSN